MEWSEIDFDKKKRGSARPKKMKIKGRRRRPPRIWCR